MDVLVTYRRIGFATVLVRNAESVSQVKELLESDNEEVQDLFEYGMDEAFGDHDSTYDENEVWDVLGADGPVLRSDYDAEVDLDELEDFSDEEETES